MTQFLVDRINRFFTLDAHVMWEYVGMGRTAEGLKKGIAELKEIRKEFETNLFIPGSKEGMNVELDKAIRLYDFTD